MGKPVTETDRPEGSRLVKESRGEAEREGQRMEETGATTMPPEAPGEAGIQQSQCWSWKARGVGWEARIEKRKNSPYLSPMQADSGTLLQILASWVALALSRRYPSRLLISQDRQAGNQATLRRFSVSCPQPRDSGLVPFTSHATGVGGSVPYRAAGGPLGYFLAFAPGPLPLIRANVRIGLARLSAALS